MTNSSLQTALEKYYKSSKLGYDFILGGVKHFGYHPTDGTRISEEKALEATQELIGNALELGPDDVVLDAGCGRGVVATYLAKMFGSQFECVDLVGFELERAKILAKHRGVESLTNFSLQDYSETDFPLGHFSAVFSCETLSHSTNLGKTLSHLYSRMSIGGRGVFLEYSIAPLSHFSPYEAYIFECVVNGSAMFALKDFQYGNFESTLKEVGFRSVVTCDITEHMKPSLRRLKDIASLAYYGFVKPMRLQKYFCNVTVSVEFYKMVQKGLIRYNVTKVAK